LPLLLLRQLLLRQLRQLLLLRRRHELQPWWQLCCGRLLLLLSLLLLLPRQLQLLLLLRQHLLLRRRQQWQGHRLRLLLQLLHICNSICVEQHLCLQGGSWFAKRLFRFLPMFLSGQSLIPIQHLFRRWRVQAHVGLWDVCESLQQKGVRRDGCKGGERSKPAGAADHVLQDAIIAGVVDHTLQKSFQSRLDFAVEHLGEVRCVRVGVLSGVLAMPSGNRFSWWRGMPTRIASRRGVWGMGVA
jgi:hypothetical protein